MRHLKNLEVWIQSRILTKEIYMLTNYLPKEEKFGLESPIWSFVVSIPANIAEGAAKDSQKDYLRYLQISLGSSFELESHLILCANLEFLKQEITNVHLQTIELLQKRIASLIKYVKTGI